jgi:sodium transport system ATP-binding protein
LFQLLMIEVANLAKHFEDRKRGQVKAVDGVSFVCHPGEIFGLLGVNGAGKTTTLRMLATLLTPTGGTAVIAGADVVREPARVRQNVGFLSTATALYGRLTAREMVEYFGRLNGLDEAKLKERVDALFERLEMNEFKDGRCDKLSTGQKQRVSIARTLVHDPPVMIFDEPTNGLDVLAARTIVEFIRECRERGRTVIFSSHVMSEVARLCDRIAIIHRGRMCVTGTVAELRAHFDIEDLEELFIKAVEEMK